MLTLGRNNIAWEVECFSVSVVPLLDESEPSKTEMEVQDFPSQLTDDLAINFIDHLVDRMVVVQPIYDAALEDTTLGKFPFTAKPEVKSKDELAKLEKEEQKMAKMVKKEEKVAGKAEKAKEKAIDAKEKLKTGVPPAKPSVPSTPRGSKGKGKVKGKATMGKQLKFEKPERPSKGKGKTPPKPKSKRR